MAVIVNCQVRKCTKCTEKDVLSNWSLLVVIQGDDMSGKVSYSIDGSVGKQSRAKRGKIKPLKGRVTHCAIIEIEPIDVDACTQLCVPHMLRPPLRVVSLPTTEAMGVISVFTLAHLFLCVYRAIGTYSKTPIHFSPMLGAAS